jgi:hypothetical protein
MRILTVAAVSAALLGCATTPPPETTAAAPPPPVAPLPASELRELTAAEKALLTKGFADSLKDPTSAQFRWAKVPKTLNGGSVSYCAMVNGKNSYGGYNGMTPFLGVILVRDGKITGGVIVGINNDAVPQVCRDKGLDPFAVVVEAVTTSPTVKPKVIPNRAASLEAPPATTTATVTTSPAPVAEPKTKSAKVGRCRTPDDRAADGSRCGNRAASVRRGGG